MIATELTCQWSNGGCDHACIDTETGVNCSCYDGYQLIDNQTCSGTISYFCAWECTVAHDRHI